ncbi:hypothetical protein ACIOJE_01895 [Kitasatospora sp. NPDC087861]|uniref:hypothetical protein n=1 Tax=Kitasatospora sp. NPDC087861 TaxID=3364070 RepID=UPI00381DF540
MARGTAHQVELLRAEVGKTLQTGLEEIRNNTDSLRAELTATLAAGLSEHRDEFFEAIAREQQEASRAHQDNRSLHRQLGNLRTELTALQNSRRSPTGEGPAESPQPSADSAKAASQPAEITRETETQNSTGDLAAEDGLPPVDDGECGDSHGGGDLPNAEIPASDLAAEAASPFATCEATESDSEETTMTEPAATSSLPLAPHILTKDQVSQIAAEVAAQLAERQQAFPAPARQEPEQETAEDVAPEPAIASAPAEDQARLIAAEVAAQLADLLRPQPDAEQDTEVESEATEAVELATAAENLVIGPTDDVSGLIPESFAWESHVSTLRKAAAVKTVAISCHPETWDFLAAQVEGTDHFSKPLNDGNEDTVLSGRSTIALLNALRQTAYSGVGGDTGIETWALAVTSYERIAAVINSTRPGGEVGGDEHLQQPHIVLDDRSSNSSPNGG